MKTDKQITEGIMRRVYGVYVLRQLSKPMVRLGVLLALLVSLRELVWVSRVFENMSQKNGVAEFIGYGFSAFAGTELMVQLVVLAAGFIFVYSVKDLFGFRQARFA